MHTNIFVKRPGMATMRVRVFRRRPWQMKAARAMQRAGIAEHAICRALGINRERFQKRIGPHAFFKI